ncbi:hypothetical protein LCGC14_3048640, partial [marine sediment metagenome]
LESDKNADIKQLVEETQKFRTDVTLNASEQIQESIRQEIELYQRLASAISDTLQTRIGSNAIISGVPLGGRETGGSIQQSGLFRLHQGETVLTKREARGSGGMVVNINGGTFLSEEAAEQIGDMILDKVKSNLRM